MRYENDPRAGKPWPPVLRRVITVDEAQERDGRVIRVVPLVEVWAHQVVIRWLHSFDALMGALEAAGGSGKPVAPEYQYLFEVPALKDDAGTEYRTSGSGGAGGLGEGATFAPAPPPEATRLRFTWPGGEETIVALDGT